MNVVPPSRERVTYFNQLLAPYFGPETRKSIIQLIVSATGFVLSWVGALLALRVGYWLTILLALPTAGFMMRLFMIQHDCGHGSFFRSRRARDWVGRIIGVITLTPYAYWRKSHAYHHSHTGDLDFRGFGDVSTLTVQEYLALPWRKRFAYRFYRNPLVTFGIGPIFLFLIKHRFPWDTPRSWTASWRSVWLTNLALFGVLVFMALTIGLGSFFLVQIPVTLFASAAGVWLFYVQHQFENTYWDWHDDWDFYDAALVGSSHLALPKPLQWLTASIGLHHVHHLSSRIPNYRLQKAMDENPEL